MKPRATAKDWLPLAKAGRVAPGEPTGEAFDAACIDFENGIRVGNLEPHERITRILKHRLETAHGVPFVTDRWGRGVFWQWICWIPRPNRAAKPISSSANRLRAGVRARACASLSSPCCQRSAIDVSARISIGKRDGPGDWRGPSCGR